jgi:hypothetical protein
MRTREGDKHMATSPAPTPAAAGPKVSKSYGVSLSDAAGSQLRIVAVRKADGSATSFVTHVERDKEGKVKSSQKGGTTTHANMDEAKAHVDSVAKKATQGGWTARKSSVARSKPDAFSLKELPAAKAKGGK